MSEWPDEMAPEPDRPAVFCKCGAPMRYHEDTDSWACPQTLDGDDWGRPRKDHIHYLPDELV